MKELLKREIDRLRKYYPPFENWRFWVIQFVAILIAVLHSAVEHVGYFVPLERFYFVPISLLVVPVVFAALIFGFAGSIGTAIWVVALSIPNVIFGHTGIERLGEIFQLGILVTMAVLMGQIIDRERTSRNKIELANAALQASEIKYRSLFDSSPIPILVLDKGNIIIEANPSARALFNKTVEALKGTSVNLLGIKVPEKSPLYPEKNNWRETDLVTHVKEGSEIYLEPTYTKVNDIQGNAITQILLRDITEERHRQAGLKAYTAYMIRAQEEERLHIARELHDEPIQTLALLCRQLNSIDEKGETLPPSSLKAIQKAREMAQNVVKELRDFTRALRPPILDDLGMVASVRRLLVDFMDRNKINGRLKIVGVETRLPRDVELVIFRVAQEALSNVERHARANNVEITIIFGENGTELNVRDDGIGFNVQSVIGASSASVQLGLVGMEERAELCGGKFEIKSAPGKGTTVSILIPPQKSILEKEAPD
jgi:PAS domain S-box-containing protein